MTASSEDRPPFEVFRGSEAPTIFEHDCMTLEGLTPVIEQGMADYAAAGSEAGYLTDVPFSRPGMSLARLRLKSGYPLPLHSHDCDCLYYVTAGSVEIGTETLVAGDGFFVGKDVPYGYCAGPYGAVVIEFRSTDRFNMRILLKTASAWDKVAGEVGAAHERWVNEELPAIG